MIPGSRDGHTVSPKCARDARRAARGASGGATPTSNLVMGQCPEGALPLQTRSACRPEGPETPVGIIMGVYFESPSNPLGLLASPMSLMSPLHPRGYSGQSFVTA